MLSRFLDNPTSDYQDPESGRVRSRGWRWYHYAEIVAIAFVFLSLFVLFGVVSTEKPSNVNNYYSSSISSNFASTSTIKGITPGKAVSFSSDGQIQVGAGTSVYMDIGNIKVDCPSYPSLLAVTGSTYLLSYADEGTEKSTLQMIQVASTATGMTATSSTPTPSTFYIYEMALLPESNGMFVAICQDTSVEDETAYVLVGKADVATSTVTIYDASAVLYAKTYSVNPTIIALSSNSFLIGFYDINPYQLAITVGRIDFSQASPVISLSQPVPFQNDDTYSFYFTLTPLTSSTAMLLMYNNTTPMNINGAGVLQASVVTVSGGSSTDASQATVTPSNFTALESSQVSYYMSATTLNPQTVVVAYADASQDFAVVCQVINLAIQSSGQPNIVFGSSWTVNSGRALTGDLKTGLMDIDITTVSTAGEFIVLFSDLSANAATIAASAQLTATGEIVRTSPDFLLNQGNDNLDTMASWGALASGIQTPLQSQTAMFTIVASTGCNALATSSFNVIERYPNPVGVVSTSAEVAVQGSISWPSSNLVPGKKYYSTTKGNLVADNNYAGRGSGYCPASPTITATMGCAGYVYDATNKVMVTLDSQVGLSLSSNTLAVISSV